MFEKKEGVKRQKTFKQKISSAPRETPVSIGKEAQLDSNRETNKKQAKPPKKTKKLNTKEENENHLDQLLEMKRKKKR